MNSKAGQLLGQRPIMFSGADLQKGRMIIEKLAQEGHVPECDQRPVHLLPCVIFIDEAQALPTPVANILLSALDDARLTTIDNVDYDFGDVVFLMATTDAGKLTEAFRSRPDRVLLRNYTLDELLASSGYMDSVNSTATPSHEKYVLRSPRELAPCRA